MNSFLKDFCGSLKDHFSHSRNGNEVVRKRKEMSPTELFPMCLHWSLRGEMVSLKFL